MALKKSRFIDTEFNNKQLPPICGYWSEKLVPLEQALKFIISSVEQLGRSIKAAKKYCHFPSEHGLTHDESAALYLYTMEGGANSFYLVLNQALRFEDRAVLKPWFPYLKLLDTALSKLPTVRGCIWRGVEGDIGKTCKKDQDLIWWSVTSCSLSVDTIKDFLPAETVSTLYMIEVINGKDISAYANYPTENEVLLSPGTQLRVAANPLNISGGLYLVHLMEVPDESDETLSSLVSMTAVSPKLTARSTSQVDNLETASTLSPVPQATKTPSLFRKSTNGGKPSITKSTSMSSAQATKKESHSESKSRHRNNPPCSGRRCPNCGRCRWECRRLFYFGRTRGMSNCFGFCVAHCLFSC